MPSQHGKSTVNSFAPKRWQDFTVRRFFYIVLLSISTAFSAENAAALEVVASIKPIHSLVASVMEGSGSMPRLIVTGQQSPHGFALKPSHMHTITNADAVFYVDEHFETFLAPALRAAPASCQPVELMNAPNIEHLALRTGGAWPAHAHDEHEHHNEEHHDDAPEGGEDGHIWLSPANAAAMAQEIARVLAAKDPRNEALYYANSRELRARLQRLDDELRATLSPVRAIPFLVYHDAYQYAEKRYNLEGVGAISEEPEHPLPARRLLEMRQQMARNQVMCVFHEPQFPNHLVERLVGDTGVRIGMLDPEGGNLQPGPELYEALMRQLSSQWLGCLEKEHPIEALVIE
jgi:zinc transport system substrate-binding protein